MLLRIPNMRVMTMTRLSFVVRCGHTQAVFYMYHRILTLVLLYQYHLSFTYTYPVPRGFSEQKLILDVV